MRLVQGLEQLRADLQRREPIRATKEDRANVAAIIEAVRTEGDAAAKRYGHLYDGAEIDDWDVPAASWDSAQRDVPKELSDAIRTAIQRVRAFHEQQPKGGFLLRNNGSILGQLIEPLRRVACYVPGGTAPLFSTLLMLAVPARVAGVKDIVVATPPRRDGTVAPEILVAAKELGIDTVLRIGGAQAIAALAYGTETIDRADKVVGPGNRFVVLAKQLLYGTVGVESLPGPTETLIVADDSAHARHVAADLLAQAEHDDATPMLATTSRRLVSDVQHELGEQLSTLSTAEAARASLTQRGLAILVRDLDEAIAAANEIAPEHLCLLLRDPWSAVSRVKNAGGIFVGSDSLEALGDYAAGPSHVMPTGGTARFASAVSVTDFLKIIPVVDVSRSELSALGPAAAKLARAEGLEAHARAIESRLE